MKIGLLVKEGIIVPLLSFYMYMVTIIYTPNVRDSFLIYNDIDRASFFDPFVNKVLEVQRHTPSPIGTEVMATGKALYSV